MTDLNPSRRAGTQPSDIVALLQDLQRREYDAMRPHLANMDSRGQISSQGNFHSGVAKGFEIAINLIKTLKDEPNV